MKLFEGTEGLENSTENSIGSTEQYWRIFDVNLAWIRQSDTKAYTMFTVYGISISVVFSKIDTIAAELSQSYMMIALATIYILSSMIALVFGFRCIQPSLKLKVPPSIIFFGSISRAYQSGEAYYEGSRPTANDVQAMEKELCNQIYINSIIARGKYDDISKSITAFLVSLITLIMIILYYIL
jgi:hypothetical protein